MKIIDLANKKPTLDEAIGMAEKEIIILRNSAGKMLVLSEIDEFDLEVELLKNNQEFMAFLKQLSKEPPAISLSALEQSLGL